MDIIKPMIEGVLYPLMEIKNGNRIRKYRSELLRSQNYTKSQLIDLQKEKLASLLCACADGVPAYADLQLTAEEIRRDPYAALQRVPILTKRQFQADSERYINGKADRSGFILNKSGGSTGEPVVFFMDRYTVEHYEAARWRGMSWWGITPGSRSVMIWGNPIELSANQAESYRKKDKYLKNRITISAYQLNPECIYRPLPSRIFVRLCYGSVRLRLADGTGIRAPSHFFKSCRLYLRNAARRAAPGNRTRLFLPLRQRIRRQGCWYFRV